MSRRRFITGLVALDIVACTLADLRPRGPRPCRATFELVRVGMTLEEIVAVVGGPPQPYNTIPVTYEWIGHPDPRWSYENWTVNDAGLIVYFDEIGRAAEVDISEVHPAPDDRNLLERIRDRLGF